MISEKLSCRPISRGKKHANKSLMTYNAENKNLIPLYVGEKVSNSREVWEKLFQYKLNQ